jgi:hypothetical protein
MIGISSLLKGSLPAGSVPCERDLRSTFDRLGFCCCDSLAGTGTHYYAWPPHAGLREQRVRYR